jgi:nucleoid-associated protein YgaU
MNLLTQDQVYDLGRSVGLTIDNARIASAIAMCESPYTQNNVAHSDFSAVGDQALANEVWGYSYGGFQIRSLRADKGTGNLRDEVPLLDPQRNAYVARKIFRQNMTWRPWSTYASGMYKAYLQDIFPPPPNSHVVLAGESLSKITAQYDDGWTWQDLARANGLHDPFTIFIGQVLLLPSDTIGA